MSKLSDARCKKAARRAILASFGANVLSVLVVDGETVTAGQPVVIMESMKMEIPVLAERSGRILEVKVTAGDVVQEGEVLVVIDD